MQSKPWLGKSFVTLAAFTAMVLLAPGVQAMAAGEGAALIEPAATDSALALRIEQRDAFAGRHRLHARRQQRHRCEGRKRYKTFAQPRLALD